MSDAEAKAAATTEVNSTDTVMQKRVALSLADPDLGEAEEFMRAHGVWDEVIN